MQSSTQSSANTKQRLQIALLHGVTLVLLGLHLYIRTFPLTPTPIPEATDPEAAWWGFWMMNYLPGWVVWLWAGLVVGLIIICWLSEIGRLGDWEIKRIGNTYYALLALAIFVAFFLFPSAHTRWGDAYILAKGIAYPDPALRTVYSWQAPLDVFLHSQIWRWFGMQLGAIDDATPIYRLLSPLAGAIYLAVVLAISRDRRIAPVWLSFGMLTTLGLMQLFFGYVENYSFVAAGILAYLWLGIGVLRGERPLWLAASVLALCNAFHPSTVVLAPSLLYLGWGVREIGRLGDWELAHHAPRNTQWLSIVLQIGLPMILVAGGTIVLMEVGGHGLTALFTTDRPGGGDSSWFVPIWQTTTRWEHYTMFSWQHLRDWLNGLILVAPAASTTLLFSGWWIKDKESSRQGDRKNVLRNPQSAIRIFLLNATLCYLLFTWIWNADYGGQRDWDLFSLSVLPLTMLLIVWLPTKLEDRYLRMGMLPLIVLQALHTAAWIYQNTLPWEWPS